MRRLVDAQVHVYTHDQPRQPWRAGGVTEGPGEVTASGMVAAMDRVGVDRAVLVSYFAPYGYDASYALRCADEFGDRFRVVAPVDPQRADLDAAVDALAHEPAVVGLRLLMMSDDAVHRGADGAFDALLRAARRHDLPLSVMTWQPAVLATLAARHPDTMIVVDHLALEQPRGVGDPKRGFEDLGQLLAAAPCDNVRVKVSGVPTLSREPAPFDDLWPHLERIFAAFGVDRCLWGSDWTRVAPFATYEQSLDYLRATTRLGAADKDAVLGATASRVYGWA